MTATVTWFGDRAVAVALSEASDREEVARRLERAFPRLEVRRGMATVLVAGEEPDPSLLSAVSAALLPSSGDVEPSAASTGAQTAVVRIDVAYDGPDLVDVAARLEVSTDAVVRAHQQQEWRVAMMGFAPGFGYLVPEGVDVLPWARLERRARPRDRVEAGAVAVAAGMSAVYPQAMPGGWLVLGHTSARLFDPGQADRPALLAPGDVVRFAAGPR